MNVNPLITIFTPTYNRANTIKNLYKSLINQTLKDFEWLIIDDGSSDNTQDLIEEFKKENKIKIQYIYKENQGKHRAINDALDIASGELFTIVDSDDFLTNDAIDTIKKYYLQIKDKDDFIGVVGLRGDRKGKILCSYLHEKKSKNKYYDKEFIDANFIEYRYKYKISGDRAEVCITNKMKKFKFPVIENEKFMFESYIWNQMAEANYKFRYFNKIIYITEYLQDGLSHNIKEKLIKSPNNQMITNNQTVKIKQIPIKKRIKSCINYYRYGKLTNQTIISLLKKSNSKIMSIFAIPIAVLHPIKINKSEGKKNE